VDKRLTARKLSLGLALLALPCAVLAQSSPQPAATDRPFTTRININLNGDDLRQLLASPSPLPSGSAGPAPTASPRPSARPSSSARPSPRPSAKPTRTPRPQDTFEAPNTFETPHN